MSLNGDPGEPRLVDPPTGDHHPPGSEDAMSARPEGEPPLADALGETAAPVIVTDLASKTLAVKEGETFLYSDLEGTLDHGGEYGLRLCSKDTPFLPSFRMTVSGRPP